MHYSRIFILLTFIYAAFIFYLSSLPPDLIPSEAPRLIYRIFLLVKQSGLEFLAYPLYPAVKYPDKFIHLILYFGFGILLNASFRSSNYNHPSLYSFLVGSLYGISDEIHQIFVPGRTASFLDFTADIVGITVAQIVVLTFILLKKRKYSEKEKPNI